jgi:hypothetical protein
MLAGMFVAIGLLIILLLCDTYGHHYPDFFIIELKDIHVSGQLRSELMKMVLKFSD